MTCLVYRDPLGIPMNAPLATHEYLNESDIPFWAVEWRDKKLRCWRQIKSFRNKEDAKKFYHELKLGKENGQ